MYRRNITPIYIIVSMLKSILLTIVSVKVVVFRNLTTMLMEDLEYFPSPQPMIYMNQIHEVLCFEVIGSHIWTRLKTTYELSIS